MGIFNSMLRTPWPNAPSVVDFCRDLNSVSRPALVPVIESAGPIGRCYWNVDKVAKERGGARVLGWQISELPGQYLGAMHHAIWATSRGDLFDPTPPTNPAMKEVLFIASEDQELDFGDKKVIPTRFHPLRSSPIISAFIDAVANNEASKTDENQARLNKVTLLLAEEMVGRGEAYRIKPST